MLALRVRESLPFCGVALLGGLMNQKTSDCLFPLPLGFTVASAFFLSVFAFMFNDLQDREHDRKSGSKSNRPLVNGSLSVGAGQAISFGVAIVGIALLAIGSTWTALCLGLSTIPVGAAYSWKRLPLKTVPALSSLSHMVFGILIFTLGAWSVSELTMVPLAVGAYFGLVFAAGHLHHEVADLETDRSSGVETHAVRYGGKSTLWAGFVLWCISCAYFTALALLRVVPRALGWIQLGMFACYLIGFFIIPGRSRSPALLKRLQTVYRATYLVGGSLMVAMLLLGTGS